MSKPAKPDESAESKPKSKKMLIIIIAVVVLLAAAGGAAFFMMKKDHAPKHGEEAVAETTADDAESEADSKLPPKFVDIGTFTANLLREDSDRALQVAITLKLNKPELEEKIKQYSPEIMHTVNMLLQSKRASELATVAGKEKLASQIKEQIEFVLGLRKSAPPIHATPAEGEPPIAAEVATPSKKGIAEVLFTSFLIQ